MHVRRPSMIVLHEAGPASSASSHTVAWIATDRPLVGVDEKQAPAGFPNLMAFAIFTVWLYGTLVLAERRAGYVIILLGAIFGLAVPVIHMSGSEGLMGGAIGKSDEAFFFVWTLLALGAASSFSAVLAVRGLWSQRRSRPR